MNEIDCHNMLVARCKALEEIALDYVLLHALDTGTGTPSEADCKRWLEARVEKLAPGCSHRA